MFSKEIFGQGQAFGLLSGQSILDRFCFHNRYKWEICAIMKPHTFQVEGPKTAIICMTLSFWGQQACHFSLCSVAPAAGCRRLARRKSEGKPIKQTDKCALYHEYICNVLGLLTNPSIVCTGRNHLRQRVNLRRTLIHRGCPSPGLHAQQNRLLQFFYAF